MNKKWISRIKVVVLIIVVFVGFCIWFLSGAGSTYYYAQIDNSKAEENKTKGGVINFNGSMDYLYTLFSYDKNGKGKNIKFGTSKKLKEGAFIRLKVMPVRGVLEWKEIQYNELPDAVQGNYTVPINKS